MFIGFMVLSLGALGLLSLVLGNPGPFATAVDVTSRRRAAAWPTPAGSSARSPPIRCQVVSPVGAFIVRSGSRRARPLIFTGTSFAELGRKFAATP